MQKLPDLEAWAIFAKVAETGSFARTAGEFGLSQATVSKAITRLETRLKTVLFHRTSRKMSLTESGRGALERASRILAEGEAVEAEITAQAASPRGQVRIAAPMSFGIAHLSPLLPEFMARYPDIALEIVFDDGVTDLIGGGYDLALRISTLADSSLLARRLCGVRILLVGSPAYLERRGRPKHPRQLADHDALFYTYSRFGNAWRFSHKRHGDFSISVATPLRVNNAEALNPALLAGQGLALQPEFLVWRELRNGKLEVVMPEWAPPPIALHVVTPPGRIRPARVQVLIDYLVRKFEKAPWADPQER
ncbi:LysR substrate-binding domain-containing protein [Lysobacter sp. Hz 25]|uniref:LysR family transcriptional regulator n=1 Tax=Lysobacter sp. Hz 25 TaxID=3383698 RepID=UPI0038D4679E